MAAEDVKLIILVTVKKDKGKHLAWRCLNLPYRQMFCELGIHKIIKTCASSEN